MHTAGKITVEVPEQLLRRAQEASGGGITQTVRTGLQLVAASLTYANGCGSYAAMFVYAHLGCTES